MENMAAVFMEQNWNIFFTYSELLLHLGEVKNFCLDTTVLPHMLNKNVHIFCKIRPRVTLGPVSKIVIW